MMERNYIRSVSCGGGAGGIYGLAFIGAGIYFIQHSISFWGGVLGILKALVWPAVVMYKVMELLKM
jgi:uncharacterized membrane protein